MPLVAFSLRLDRIEENLLYEAKDGSFWLSCICTFDEDAKGRLTVAQSVSKERFARGEKEPQIGYWRELGNKPRPAGSKPGGFDLAKYKRAPQTAGPAPPGQDNQEGGPAAAAEERKLF